MKFEGQNYYDYMNVNADRTRKNVFKAQLNGCILLYQDQICVLFLKIWIWLFLRHIFSIPKRDNFEILSSISPRWLHLLKIKKIQIVVLDDWLWNIKKKMGVPIENNPEKPHIYSPPSAIIFRLIAPDIHILHPIWMQFVQKSLGLLKMVTIPP